MAHLQSWFLLLLPYLPSWISFGLTITTAITRCLPTGYTHLPLVMVSTAWRKAFPIVELLWSLKADSLSSLISYSYITCLCLNQLQERGTRECSKLCKIYQSLTNQRHCGRDGYQNRTRILLSGEEDRGTTQRPFQAASRITLKEAQKNDSLVSFTAFNFYIFFLVLILWIYEF